jgi:hypothetical protein
MKGGRRSSAGRPAGGKSVALLIGALQSFDEPGYAAFILRRTYADLAKPGALMDRVSHSGCARTGTSAGRRPASGPRRRSAGRR